MATCRVCLRSAIGSLGFHPECLESLFGTKTLPLLDIELSKLMGLAAEMAGKMSISGVQEKVSLRRSDDRSRFEIAPTGGRYILKPEPSRFVFVPQNEHLTMRLAELAGIVVPPLGLIELRDKSMSYLIKRFDRLDNGTKLQVEDFCQLAEKPLRDKYQGSGELCVRILRKYASEPSIEIRNLFKVFLFSWWVSNGDQHLKNFSLLRTPEGRWRLAPAYDLICTRLPIPSDRDLALPICGKRSNLNRQLWLDFAEYSQIPERAAVRLLNEQIDALNPSLILIEASFLPDELKSQYQEIVRQNTELLR
ncbi:MAG: type II toxin-antitoxin system HipA family toxin [Thermoguttaceae bacterium]